MYILFEDIQKLREGSYEYKILKAKETLEAHLNKGIDIIATFDDKVIYTCEDKTFIAGQSTDTEGGYNIQPLSLRSFESAKDLEKEYIKLHISSDKESFKESLENLFDWSNKL